MSKTLSQTLWKYFWLSFSAVCIGYSTFRLEKLLTNNYFFETLSHLTARVLVPGLLVLFLVVVILWFFVKPITHIRTQKINNEPSWVFYAYFSLFAAPAISAIITVLENPTSIKSLLLRSLFFIVGIIVYELIKKSKIEEFTFAPGSVGKENDGLGFKDTAKNVCSGLNRLDDYVNVVGVYGGVGMGKSSFVRMIIENFDREKVLYSYISLTETNEAKDLSKLFSERWVETLSSRYPKIDATSSLSVMNSILRESGYSFISEITKFLTLLNPGLLRTKLKFKDKFYGNGHPAFLSLSTSRLFGNIPNFKEDFWIVVLDEIERAQPDEIYRVIEIIERFKSEGRAGLPIKIIFILCISDRELESFVNTFSNKDPRAYLIRGFFYEHPKNISLRIPLPPVDIAVWKEYIIKKVNELMEKFGIKDDSVVSLSLFQDPNRNFIRKDSEALGYSMGLLVDESPRLLDRVLCGSTFFYNSFTDPDGAPNTTTIRFSDILALEYIKVKFPFLIEFFSKTNRLFVYSDSGGGLEAYMAKEELKKTRKDLVSWVESVTGRTINNKEEIQRLIGLVAHHYQDFFGTDYEVKLKEGYFGTSSYAENLQDYLSLVPNTTETSRRKCEKSYTDHKDSLDLVKGLKNEDLLGYSHFLTNIQGVVMEKLHISVLEELVSRATNNLFKSELLATRDSSSDEPIYQIVFQALSVIEKDDTPDQIDYKNTKLAFECIRAVLVSSNVSTDSKYIILNSFANKRRGSGSRIHTRLTRAFEKIKDHFNEEVVGVINHVFNEAEQRYFSGNESLYEREGNFFYVLYQSWSGSKDASDEINRIRKAAMRGLKDHPEAILLYWKKYPFSEEWSGLNFQGVLKRDLFFSSEDLSSNEIYMPLGSLIKATKDATSVDPEVKLKMFLWEKFLQDPDYQKSVVLKDSQDTLKYALIENGLLKKKDEGDNNHLKVTSLD